MEFLRASMPKYLAERSVAVSGVHDLFRMTTRRYRPTFSRRARIHASTALLFVAWLGCAEDPAAPMTSKRPARKPEPVEDAGMQCPTFNADYRAQFKGCTADENCELVELQTSCRGTHAVYGVASADREEFDVCAPTRDSFTSCAGDPLPTRAEDGRIPAPDLHDVRARCIKGACQARIETRICGTSDRTCTADQLCVSLQNTMGTLDYECVDNPCAGQKLDCECAQPVCRRPDQTRVCTIELIGDADVYCKVERR